MTNGPASTVARGREFEDRAERWLQAKGLKTIGRNFRARGGEIDLIMGEGGGVVFVEVRYRAGPSQGGALESVTLAKQRRLAQTAALWLQRNPAYAGQPCRFDVIGIEGQRVEWIRDAFAAG